MTALPAPDGSWDGLVSFYSLIHMIDDADLRAALAEHRRVLADGGLLLLAVHAGQEILRPPRHLIIVDQDTPDRGCNDPRSLSALV